MSERQGAVRNMIGQQDTEPRRFRDVQERLLEAMSDTRCTCSATYPFHHVPGEQLSAGASRAPWDPVK